MEFLPSDYESPKSNSAYMKIQEGENRIRILSSPIIGWEDWKDKKPIRFRYNNKPEKPIDEKQPIRHFWAFIVWDYALSKISIMEISQASIRKRIEGLSKDNDWGAPYLYDIKIIKSGKSTDTEYEVNPAAPKEIDPKIKEEFLKQPIDLEELFRGGDPFNSNGVRTFAFWEKSVTISVLTNDFISSDQVGKIENEISLWINKADPEWRKRALDALKISDFSQLTRKHYDLMIKKIDDKKTQILDVEIPF